MCVNCGRYVGADHDRALPGPDCPSPDACTFDLTPSEAVLHWRKRAHDLLAERDALRDERDQAEQRGYANAMEAERKLHEDALETLAAERDAALARAEELGRELNRVKYGEPDFAWSSHLAAMNELRARAERAEDMPAVLGIIQWRGEHDIPVDNYDEAVDRAEAALRRIEERTLERAAEVAEDYNDEIWDYATGNRSRVGSDPIAEAIRGLPRRHGGTDG
jgi:hypothetical protein